MKTLCIIIATLFTTNAWSQTYHYYSGNLHAHTGYSDGNKD